MGSVRVMSFNLRMQVENDGVNSFRNRKDRIAAMLEAEKPDIIGFQEVTDEMRLWLRGTLTDYSVLGSGRDSDYGGESSCIALRNDRAEAIAMEPFWLSPTPDVPGSRYTEDQSQCPRMTLAVKVRCKGVKKPFYVLNTHTDHVGERARYCAMEQNIEYIAAHAEKFVFTGDMNATPDAKEIRIVEERLGGRGCKDVTAALGGTFHDFGRRAEKCKIDYIFTDGERVCSYLVDDAGEGGLYYSDHHAVVAEILL